VGTVAIKERGKEMKTEERRELLWRFVIGLLVLHATGVFAVWLWALSRPHMVDPIEVRVANIVALWREGYLPYNFADRLPAVWNPYGPVYEWLCAFIPSSVHPYWNGRLLSIASLILTALAIVVWSRRLTGKFSLGIVASLLLLTAKPIFAFGHLCRVDMFGVMLSALGFVLIVSNRNRSKIATMIGVLSMILAFHVKVTFVAAPVACCLALWREEKFRAIGVGLAWLVGALGGLIALQWWTEGAYLFQAQLANLPALWTKPIDMLTRPITSSLFWMLVLILYWRSNKALHIPESIYCFCNLAVAGITSTNPGSSWNYLMEFYVAASLLTARILSSFQQKARASIIALLLCHSIFSLLHTTYFMAKNVRKVVKYSQAYKQAQYQIVSLMSSNQRILLIKSLTGMDALMSFGKVNLIDLPKELTPKSEELARGALQIGEIDAVFVGDELTPMQSTKERQKLKILKAN
jgi:hypothetical protein